MKNAAKKLLFDVLESAQSIRDWCAARSFADYESDRQFRRAVEREFEIIGEALGRLTIADPVTADSSTNCRVSLVFAIALFTATTQLTMPQSGASLRATYQHC